MEKEYEKDTEPRGPDVRDEHTAIVEPRFWQEALPAMLAAVVHLKWSLKRKTRGVKLITCVASGTLHIENGIPLRLFCKRCHDVLIFLGLFSKNKYTS